MSPIETAKKMVRGAARRGWVSSSSSSTPAV
jgi:hypothetical protein